MEHYSTIVDNYCGNDPAVFSSRRGALLKLLAGYLEAIQFTDGAHEADGDELAGLDLTVEGEGGWGTGEIVAMLEEIEAFVALARPLVAERIGLGELWADGSPYTLSRCGADFWFTRNGHGVGFWDRKYTSGDARDEITGLGDALSSLVGLGTEFPNKDAYRGKDSRAYLD